MRDRGGAISANQANEHCRAVGELVWRAQRCTVYITARSLALAVRGSTVSLCAAGRAIAIDRHVGYLGSSSEHLLYLLAGQLAQQLAAFLCELRRRIDVAFCVHAVNEEA
eukprot:2949891-Pleurochrysis_carterae.AAC.1